LKKKISLPEEKIVFALDPLYVVDKTNKKDNPVTFAALYS
jgi:hypothetical protein